MCPPTRASENHAAGFTLIEALVALAVASAGISAIATLSFASLRSSLDVERHLALVETAEMIVAGLPARGDLAAGATSGVVDAHKWRIQAGPFTSALAAPSSATDWAPQRIALQVLSPSGAVIHVDTVRLRKRGAP